MASMDPPQPTSVGLQMAFLAGLSTVIGSLVLFIFPDGRPSSAIMASALGLAGGAMLTVSMEMVHSEQGIGWRTLTLFGLSFFGSLLVCTIAEALVKGFGKSEDAVVDPERQQPSDDQSALRTRRAAVLLFLAVTLHNIPEGFAVGISALSYTFSPSICVAVALHNIPEGVALAIGTFSATKSRATGVHATLVSGLAEPLGAICAIWLLRPYITPSFMDDALVLVAGLMSYISVVLLSEGVALHPFGMCLGCILGVLVLTLTDLALGVSACSGGKCALPQPLQR